MGGGGGILGLYVCCGFGMAAVALTAFLLVRWGRKREADARRLGAAPGDDAKPPGPR